MKAIGRPSSRPARRLLASAAAAASASHPSPFVVRSSSSSIDRTSGNRRLPTSTRIRASPAAPLQARQLSLGSIFSKRPTAGGASTSTGAEPVGSTSALEEGPVAAWSAELAELSQRAAVGRTEDVDRAEGLFREILDGSSELDGTVRREGARLIVDHWERLGGWDPSKDLFHSPSIFALYVQALVILGESQSVNKAIKIRDDLLQRHSAVPASPTSSFASAGAGGVVSVGATSRGAADGPLYTPPAEEGAARLLASGQSGKTAEPVHVVVDEKKDGWFTGRSFWYAVGTGIKWFGFATIAVLVMEQAGTVKLGPSVNEFESTKDGGKVVKFDDVKGCEEAKDELQEIVEFLKDPTRFSTLGGRLPKGVLLTGPPGTGKTMLARAVAGEAGVPFFFASGSEFEEMFVGVGAKRIRELFAAAKKKSPAIIFIDELDSVGGKRSNKDQAALKQTVNQLLTELDGFQASTGIIVIAATNFPQSLDPALVRPGRFDRHVNVPLPDVRGRVEILKHYIKDITVAPEVDPSIIARGTPGMSGAELANLVNQAAVKASRDRALAVSLLDFEWAKDRIMMGAERKSHFVTPEAKRMTAFHEGGHALVAMLTEGAMPLHKVTVLPRGQALGITFQLPEADKDSYSKKEYLARIDVAMGGRVAEELIYGTENVTSGAHSDLVAATNVASAMVKEMGFSEKVGLVSHGDESVYLSERKKDEIENEIRSLLEDGAKRAWDLLTTNRAKLDLLADALIRYETLSADEVREVLKGRELPGRDVAADALAGPTL